MKKLKDFLGKISYAIIPFILFGLMLLLSYFGNELLYKCGVTTASQYHKTIIDDQIPLVPWLIYFYYLTFPLGIIAFFYLAYSNKRAFFNLFITLMISFFISGLIYLFAQTILTKPDFEPKSFTDKLVVWTWNSTKPVNNFPSQHCFMAFGVMIGIISANGKGCERKMNKIFQVIAFACACMVVASTVLTKQHYFLDIIGSFDIMFITYILIWQFKLGDKLLSFCQKIKLKKNKN